jgi:ligand-binding SRPBCC domain-containing protein
MSTDDDGPADRGWGRRATTRSRRSAVVHMTFELEVVVKASPRAIWDRAVTPEGFNHELRPWVTMSWPAGALTVDDVPLGGPVGRAWLRLFGLVPFDYDRLVIVERESGRRFLERSTMFSMRRWEHERVLVEVEGGTLVRDRITCEPRLPLQPLARPLAFGVRALFRHRQRRLSDYWECR